MEQQITVPISIFLGDIDITNGPAVISVVDGGPVEMVVPVDLGALGDMSIRFG